MIYIVYRKRNKKELEEEFKKWKKLYESGKLIEEKEMTEEYIRKEVEGWYEYKLLKRFKTMKGAIDFAKKQDQTRLKIISYSQDEYDEDVTYYYYPSLGKWSNEMELSADIYALELKLNALKNAYEKGR